MFCVNLNGTLSGQLRSWQTKQIRENFPRTEPPVVSKSLLFLVQTQFRSQCGRLHRFLCESKCYFRVDLRCQARDQQSSTRQLNGSSFSWRCTMTVGTAQIDRQRRIERQVNDSGRYRQKLFAFFGPKPCLNDPGNIGTPTLLDNIVNVHQCHWALCYQRCNLPVVLCFQPTRVPIQHKGVSAAHVIPKHLCLTGYLPQFSGSKERCCTS